MRVKGRILIYGDHGDGSPGCYGDLAVEKNCEIEEEGWIKGPIGNVGGEMVKDAVKDMRIGRATGPSGLSGEMLNA